MSGSWEGLTPPYSTIVADPPWTYPSGVGITTAGRHRRVQPAADARYSTLTNEDLADLPVADLAATDAHLYLWVTNPKLYGSPNPAEIMEAWGFRYVTCLTWLKQGNMGMGFYFRGDTEHVLFGVRGKLPIAPEKRERNVIRAAKRGHSIKPGAFADLVERVSPGPYVELFARQPRLGWDSWGHGVEAVG